MNCWWIKLFSRNLLCVNIMWSTLHTYCSTPNHGPSKHGTRNPGNVQQDKIIGRRRRRKPKLDLSKYDLEQLSEVAQTVGSGNLLLLMDLVCWPSFSGCSINKQHYSKWQWSETDASSKPMTLQYVYECSFLKRMTFGCLLTYVCPCACIFSTQKE